MARGDRNGSRLYPERLHRGEQHHSSKLTSAQVIEIRKLYESGSTTFEALGYQFGVSGVNARSVVRRDTWKHIP
jgi:hypothetical protein